MHNTNQCVYSIYYLHLLLFYSNCFCYCFRCQVDETLHDVIDIYVHTKQGKIYVLHIVVK